MSKITMSELKAVAEDFNSQYEKPVIHVTAETTLDELKKNIIKYGDKLEDGDVLFQKTIDLLIEMEIDIPSKIKIKKPIAAVKEIPATKEKAKQTVSKAAAQTSKIENIEKTPSNKLIIFKAWKNGNNDIAQLHTLVGEAVKETTIRAWISAWKKDTGLPKGAQE